MMATMMVRSQGRHELEDTMSLGLPNSAATSSRATRSGLESDRQAGRQRRWAATALTFLSFRVLLCVCFFCEFLMSIDLGSNIVLGCWLGEMWLLWVRCCWLWIDFRSDTVGCAWCVRLNWADTSSRKIFIQRTSYVLVLKLHLWFFLISAAYKVPLGNQYLYGVSNQHTLEFLL